MQKNRSSGPPFFPAFWASCLQSGFGLADLVVRAAGISNGRLHPGFAVVAGLSTALWLLVLA
jgi:hypothetical protein